MAVTLHNPAQPAPQVETPTQAVTKAANEIMLCTDENGRQIGWRKLNALEDFDLTEIAGANSGNQEWMLRATIAFGVRSIDGEPVARPGNKTQLRAMVARLDDAGMAAILKMFNDVGEAAEGEAGASPETVRAKN